MWFWIDGAKLSLLVQLLKSFHADFFKKQGCPSTFGKAAYDCCQLQCLRALLITPFPTSSSTCGGAQTGTVSGPPIADRWRAPQRSGRPQVHHCGELAARGSRDLLSALLQTLPCPNPMLNCIPGVPAMAFHEQKHGPAKINETDEYVLEAIFGSWLCRRCGNGGHLFS